MVFGLDPYASGTVRVDGAVLPPMDPRAAIRAGIAFVTEDRREEGLLMDFDVVDNVALVALPRFGRSRLRLVDTRRVAEAVRGVGETLRLKARSLRGQPVRSLSGGNQQKAVIGKWLLSEARVFVLDEPTRGIDVGAKHEVYTVVDGLAAGGAAVLVVSSELEELRGICDRVVVMRQGEVTGEFPADRLESEAILRAAFGEPATVPSPEAGR
jgi:ABC-type sugar transport system ATPase subunit